MNFDEMIQFAKICDAHIHLADLANINLANNDITNIIRKKIEPLREKNYSCITCAHSPDEYEIQMNAASGSPSKIMCAFAVHPQAASFEYIPFLESLLREKKIHAVGETGLDFFSAELRETKKMQTAVFLSQLELAEKYSVPVILHGRKAAEDFFLHSKKLAKLPLIVFHSFSGTYQDALSFLKREINAAFSFSRQIANGNKKAVLCVKELPLSNILFETDAPFQTLKGETYTSPKEISRVYEKAFSLRYGSEIEKNPDGFIQFCDIIQNNLSAFKT